MAIEKSVLVPDIGDFDGVEVIEILVSAGDSIAVEDSLVTLESDKASIEIPSPYAGVVREVAVKIGDKFGLRVESIVLPPERFAAMPKRRSA